MKQTIFQQTRLECRIFPSSCHQGSSEQLLATGLESLHCPLDIRRGHDPLALQEAEQCLGESLSGRWRRLFRYCRLLYLHAGGVPVIMPMVMTVVVVVMRFSICGSITMVVIMFDKMIGMFSPMLMLRTVTVTVTVVVLVRFGNYWMVFKTVLFTVLVVPVSVPMSAVDICNIMPMPVLFALLVMVVANICYMVPMIVVMLVELSTTRIVAAMVLINKAIMTMPLWVRLTYTIISISLQPVFVDIQYNRVLCGRKSSIIGKGGPKIRQRDGNAV